MVVKSASAVTVSPAPALALQGVWSQLFVPLCCSCLFSSLWVFSVAFCHLGLLSHTILLLFLAWGSSFGVCSGLGLRCCGPCYGSSLLFLFFVGGGGSLSLVFVVLAWLLQLFRFVQITWFSWTWLLRFLLSTSSVSLVVLRKLRLKFRICPGFSLAVRLSGLFFCEQLFWLRPLQLLEVALC